MGKFIITVAFFLLGIGIVRSQDGSSYLDSLRNVQQNGVTDSIKARAFFLYADYISTDTTRAKVELEKGLKLSKNNFFLKGLYYFYDAGLYYIINTKKAIYLYKKALNIFGKIKTTESLELQARAWANLGVQYGIDGDQDKYMEVLINKSIPLSEKAKNEALVARYGINIGMLLTNQKDYETARMYFRKSMAFYDKNPEKSDIYHLELYVNFIKNFLLEENQHYADSVRYYFKKAAPVVEKNKDDRLYYAFKESEAMFLIAQGRLTETLSILKMAIPMAKKTIFLMKVIC